MTQLIPEIKRMERYFWAPTDSCIAEWNDEMAAHNRTFRRGVLMDLCPVPINSNLVFNSLDLYMLQVRR